MTDSDAARLRRRGFLALAGGAALAGCGGLRLPGSGEEETTLDAAALREMAGLEAPSVAEPTPVAVEGSHVDAGIERARTLLSRAPESLGPDEIPNGVIREDLVGMREDAEESIDAARASETRFGALGSVRRARESAAELAGAWRAIDGDLTRSEAARPAESVRDRLDEYRSERRYVGDRPVRATLLHATLERLEDGITYGLERATTRAMRGPENAPSVGEAAAGIESARAALDDASYLYGRHIHRLDESRDLRPTFEDAAGTVGERLAERAASLPDVSEDVASELVERDVSDTPAEWALRELYGELDDGRGIGSDVTIARRLLRQHRRVAQFEALERVRGRVADGETFAVRSAADVRAYRAEAIEAVRIALAADAYPALTRDAVAEFAVQIGYADNPFDDVRDEPRASLYRREIAQYVTTAAVCRSAPAASERVGDALAE